MHTGGEIKTPDRGRKLGLNTNSCGTKSLLSLLFFILTERIYGRAFNPSVLNEWPLYLRGDITPDRRLVNQRRNVVVKWHNSSWKHSKTKRFRIGDAVGDEVMALATKVTCTAYSHFCERPG